MIFGRLQLRFQNLLLIQSMPQRNVSYEQQLVMINKLTITKSMCFLLISLQDFKSRQQIIQFKGDLTQIKIMIIPLHDFIINFNKVLEMTNKIALVNKQIHTRLFQLPDEGAQLDANKKLKKVSIPPQLLLKSMIKKGLTATSNSFISRPKTANSNYKYARENRQTLDRLKSIDNHDLSKKSNKKRYEVPVETPIDFESSKTPKEFEEFDSILEKAARDLRKESQRKRIKLEKYSQQKFSYAWKRFNIPK